MAYKFKSFEKVVGAFVVIALLCLAATVVLIGRGKNFFEKKNYYYTFFKSGEGLTVGMPVMYNGIKLGQVSTVKLNPDNRIYLRFYIVAEYADKLKEDSVAQFLKPLLGQSAIKIVAGTSSSRQLENDSYIHSSDSETGQALIAQNHTVAEGPERILANVEEITWMLKDPEGPLWATLRQVAAVSSNARGITSNIEGNKDRINNILLSLEESVDNLAVITKNLKHNKLLGGRPQPDAETPARSP
jgi:phospholipid/cholesterol/gamma-HCH transport system substrate-binding protein